MFGCKVIYVRFINCSYNNVAKGIPLLDKKPFLFKQEKIHASKSFWKIYPLITLIISGTQPKLSNHLGCLALVVFLILCDFKCLVSHPHDGVGCWMVCDLLCNAKVCLYFENSKAVSLRPHMDGDGLG